MYVSTFLMHNHVISEEILVYATKFLCCKSVCLGKISDVALEKMHFTWFPKWVFSHSSPNPATWLWAGYG